MKQIADMEKIGKRTPYTVPEGFHEEFRGRLLATSAKVTPLTPSRIRRVALWGGGVAVAVAVAIGVILGSPKPLSDFEAMLAELSDEQCNALIESYNNDIFLATME